MAASKELLATLLPSDKMMHYIAIDMTLNVTYFITAAVDKKTKKKKLNNLQNRLLKCHVCPQVCDGSIFGQTT